MGSLEELLRTPEMSSTDSIPTGFYSQKLWGLIFLALELWAGGTGVGLGPLAPEISLLNFYPPHMDVGLRLCPSHQLAWMYFFFNPIVVGLPFIFISDGSD